MPPSNLPEISPRLPTGSVPLPAAAAAPVLPPVDPYALGTLAATPGDRALEEFLAKGAADHPPISGRRDVIPPLDDPQTRLIEQSLVGEGYLTAEALAEMHRTQDELDRLRPNPVLAQMMAQREVTRDRERRRAKKEQLRAESAERKRVRAEGVAERKATDIIYLGRGVSSGLADRISRVELLERRQLPLLQTPADVAEWLEIPVPKLRWLAFHEATAARTHYVRFRVPKRSGGVRELAAPQRDLARCQRRILRRLLDLLPLHEAAHGFVRDRSTATNAAVHVGRHVVVNCDLENFFPTITFSRVKGIYRRFGYSRAAATVLALLCTEPPRTSVKYAGRTFHTATGPRALPQGAATSPTLANLAAWGLDRRLAALCAKLGWKYTRYADDLTFSADAEAAKLTGFLLNRVRRIAREEGFKVNESKTRVQRRNVAQVVTGAVVNERVAAPRKLVRRLRAILHRAKHDGLAAQNRENHPFFKQWLEGMIAYVSMLNAAQGTALRTAFEALPETRNPAS